MTINWPGPLFYPPIGKIAVMNSGARIEIWGNESDSADCFTGLLLDAGASYGKRVVFDLSCMWGREYIDHIEEPTEADKSVMEFAA
ncbi:hypothetical protein G6M50_06185 [Agrobacterium rhizogenes]|nr:hypothetical protein [Rhizobium rhizogenes]NTJ77391.1 hypothetical protein [Rhizobium rhizogenes]